LVHPRSERRVQLVALNELGRLAVRLAALSHLQFSLAVVVRASAALPLGGSLRNRDAHGAGGTSDDLRRSVDIVGVEGLHLHLRDLTALGRSDRTDLVGVGITRTLGEAGGLL